MFGLTFVPLLPKKRAVLPPSAFSSSAASAARASATSAIPTGAIGAITLGSRLAASLFERLVRDLDRPEITGSESSNELFLGGELLCEEGEPLATVLRTVLSRAAACRRCAAGHCLYCYAIRSRVRRVRTDFDSGNSGDCEDSVTRRCAALALVGVRENDNSVAVLGPCCNFGELGPLKRGQLSPLLASQVRVERRGEDECVTSSGADFDANEHREVVLAIGDRGGGARGVLAIDNTDAVDASPLGFGDRVVDGVVSGEVGVGVKVEQHSVSVDKPASAVSTQPMACKRAIGKTPGD